MRAKGNGVWGVYGIALLGLFTCLMLHIRKTPRSGFWQAAWVTSTLFGYIHTGNGGENQQTRVRGPRIAQIRMLKPQNP